MKYLLLLLIGLLVITTSCDKEEDPKPTIGNDVVWSEGTTDYRWHDCQCQFQTTGAWTDAQNAKCEQTYQSPCQ